MFSCFAKEVVTAIVSDPICFDAFLFILYRECR